MTRRKTLFCDYVQPKYLYIRVMLGVLLLVMAFRALPAVGDAPLPPARERGTLLIEVSGVAGGKGAIRAALWRSGSGFPSDVKQAWRVAVGEAGAAGGRILLEGIPYGRWAVSLFHDENGNQELDRNLLGIPTEAFGASNNRGSRFRAPEFADATIQLDAPTRILRIELIHPF